MALSPTGRYRVEVTGVRGGITAALEALRDDVVEARDDAMGAADGAAASAGDAAASADAASLVKDELEEFGPTSFQFSESVAAEMLATTNAGKYVSRQGSDSAAGTSVAPYLTIAKAVDEQAEGPLYMPLASDQKHPLLKADQQFGGVTGSNDQPRNVWHYGGGEKAPMLDGRQDLSGKTWTVVSGAAWETTATLSEVAKLTGVEVADNSKFQLWYDDDADGGTRLTWKTGGANVAANDAEVVANAGSFAINIVGSTAGDIRTTGSTSTSVRLVVHMPDGSNPNGKRLMLGDRVIMADFRGGTHGHLRFIGGIGKDSITALQLNGVSSTFRSIESINAPCHGAVLLAAKVFGTFKAHLVPTPGESVAAKGRTFGAGVVNYTGGYVDDDLYYGKIDVANGTYGHYFHGNDSHVGYRSCTVKRRSRIENCTYGIQIGGTGTPGQAFVTNGVTYEGGVDIVGGENPFTVADDVLTINGGIDWTPATDDRVVLTQFYGGGTIHLKNLRWDMTDATDARALAWFTPYGAHISGSFFPTLILDNCHDDTTISGGRYKANFYAVDTGNASQGRVILDLRGDVTLGDIRGGSPIANVWPQGFYADAVGDKFFGCGGMKRKTFEAGMAALGRSCVGALNVAFVDKDGNVISPQGVVDPEPVEGSELVTNGGFATDSDWTKETGWTISGGTANASISGAFSNLYQDVTGADEGGEYRVRVDVTITSGTCRVLLGSNLLAELTASDSLEVDVELTSGGSNQRLSIYGWGNLVGSVDNASVKELTYP